MGSVGLRGRSLEGSVRSRCRSPALAGRQRLLEHVRTDAVRPGGPERSVRRIGGPLPRPALASRDLSAEHAMVPLQLRFPLPVPIAPGRCGWR
jgi:hypothetical protein